MAIIKNKEKKLKKRQNPALAKLSEKSKKKLQKPSDYQPFSQVTF